MALSGVWSIHDYPLSKGAFLYQVAPGPGEQVWASVIKNVTHTNSDGSTVGTTRTEGVLLINQGSKTFYPIQEVGLPSHAIYQMMCDEAGNLWLEMPSVLCRFDGKTTEFFQAGEKGLPPRAVSKLLYGCASLRALFAK